MNLALFQKFKYLITQKLDRASDTCRQFYINKYRYNEKELDSMPYLWFNECFVSHFVDENHYDLVGLNKKDSKLKMLTYCAAINKTVSKTLESYHNNYLKSPYMDCNYYSENVHNVDQKIQINQPKISNHTAPITPKEDHSAPIIQKGNFTTPTLQNNIHQTPTLQNNVHQTPTLQNNIHQTPTLQNNIHQTPTLQNNIHQTPTLQNNIHQTHHKENENKKVDEKAFFDDEDERHHTILAKVGEGATSIVYKIIDNRTRKLMCKKVLKVKPNTTTFNDLKNIMKEFDVLHRINHPCICKALAINTQEKIEDSPDQSITTVSLLLEYLEYSLKDCIDKNIFKNTIKAKIAVEIAFGMLYIHKLGMMHRDLKIDNIMLNGLFQAKIIDFGLVHVGDFMGLETQSLTRGIGTFAYMSPEMQNEENYDNKTDVYSYGILLYVLFTGNLPKQSMRDKLNNVPIKFPLPSSSISQFCIDLIRKCIAFEPIQRPSFEIILNEMSKNSFQLADEIDSELIEQRYRELCNL